MSNPKVVIIGAGFGGLYAAQKLNKQPVDVLLIDRNNFHTFTPLLYQVATCGLEAEEIAYPVRGIFGKKSNIRFLLGEVIEIDRAAKCVYIQTDDFTRCEPYDYLIVAGGSVTNFFNMTDRAAQFFELKNLSDALAIRNHILRMYERAAWSDDDAYRRALTSIVVIGGGPTGLETAGAMHELYSHVLDKEYRGLSAQVILVEAMDRVLIPYPESLQESALKQLHDLGVQVILSNPITDITEDHIVLKDGTRIETYTVIWAAGVKANPLAEMLGVELQRGGRVPVKPTMQLFADDNVYVVGDMAYLEDPDGKPYPMLIPAAKQQGMLAAENILMRENNQQQQTFAYIDRGIMATIGRSRAVAWLFYRVKLTGYLAWLSWLGLHLVTLMGFRNRLNVLINWIWNYLTYDRSVRSIVNYTPPHEADETRSLAETRTGSLE